VSSTSFGANSPIICWAGVWSPVVRGAAGAVELAVDSGALVMPPSQRADLWLGE
jgi:hypothetical protein